MSITASNIKTRAGSGSISIDHGSLPTTNVEVKDIGVIESDFDLADDREDASNVLFNLGEFNFTCFDKLSNGSSLFEELDNISSTDIITVTLSFTLNSGRSITEVFSFTTNDITYKYLAREVEIESTFNFVLDETIGEIAGSDCSEVVLVGGYNEENDSAAPFCGLTPSTGEIHAMTAKGFVEEILGLMNTNNTVVNNSYSYNGNLPTGNNQFFVLRSDDTTTTATVRDPAKPVFYRMAVADGAILGSFMGYNFLVQRKDTSDSVSLNTDNVENLKIETSLENYFGIRLGYLSILDSSLTGNPFDGIGVHKVLLGDSDGLNSEATKYTNIYFRTTQVANASDSSGDWMDDSRNLRGTIGPTLDEDAEEGDLIIQLTGAPPSSLDVGDSVFPSNSFGRSYKVDEIDGSTLVLSEPLRHDIDAGTSMGYFPDMTTAESNIADRSVEGYKLGYNAGEGRRVEFTILGLDNLKPYQTITFDSTFNSFLNGKTFRPSKLTYDLQTDKINVEAYQIG